MKKSVYIISYITPNGVSHNWCSTFTSKKKAREERKNLQTWNPNLRFSIYKV